MKVYIITSLTSKIPLVEFRTDGNAIDITVDNTDGKFSSMVGTSFAKVKALVAKSSNLEMKEPSEPSAYLLRYLLENGDVIEITTDGKTAILNGRLLEEAEKNAIFVAIRSGELKVSRRANIAQPIPVVPSPPKEDQTYKLIERQPLDRSLIAMAREQNEAVAEMRAQANRANDDMIENMDLSDLDTPDDEAMTRGMIYYVRHGGFKGTE
jgi:hypothetical protein